MIITPHHITLHCITEFPLSFDILLLYVEIVEYDAPA